MEQTALDKVFDDRANEIETLAVKSLLGESFSAGAALQLASLVGALVRQPALTTARAAKTSASYQGFSRRSRVADEDSPMPALINSFGPTGVSSALVVQRGI